MENFIKTIVVIGLVAVLTVTETSAQQTAEEIPGWGRFEDPSGQARITVEDSAVLVTSGKNEMSVKSTIGRMPRIVGKRIKGDFDLRVRVSGDFTKEYQNGVLLVYAGPTEYLRIYNGMGRYNAVEVSTGIVTWGTFMSGRHHRPKQTSMWLRIQRISGELRSYYSYDGKKWIFSASSADILAKDGRRTSFLEPMQIMLLVQNRARSPLTVRFENFQLKEGEIEPATVVKDEDDQMRIMLRDVQDRFGVATKQGDQQPKTNAAAKTHWQLAKELFDDIAVLMNAVDRVFAANSPPTEQQIREMVSRATAKSERLKKLLPLGDHENLAFLQRVEEHQQHLQHRMEKHLGERPNFASLELDDSSRKLVMLGVFGIGDVVNRAGLPAFLNQPKDEANASGKPTKAIRALISGQKLDEAAGLLTASRMDDPQLPPLARLGISLADEYQRIGQPDRARETLIDSINYLLAMPADLIAKSDSILQALLCTMSVIADSDQARRDVLFMFDSAVKSLDSHPAEQTNIQSAKIRTLASINHGDEAQKILDPLLAQARSRFKSNPENEHDRIALAKLLNTQTQVNRLLDQHSLEPISEATKVLDDNWLVQHSDKLNCIRQYLSTHNTYVAIVSQKAPRKALMHLRKVERALTTLIDEQPEAEIRTLIHNQRHKFTNTRTNLEVELDLR